MNDGLRRALLHFTRGRIEAAEGACRDLLQIRPQDAGALHLLGLIAHRRGDQGEALHLLRRAASCAEATALHLMSYADLCCRIGDREDALHAARRAVALDGTMALGWLCLGKVLRDTPQHQECRSCFERALELDPGLREARNGLAAALVRLGDIPAAIGQFQLLLAREPDDAQVRVDFAVLLQELGRYEEALGQAQLAAARRPDLLAAHLRAAVIQMQLGRPGAALARLGALEQTLPEASPPEEMASLLALKAHLLRLAERHDEAVLLCRDALADGVESADLTHAYGLALQAAGAETEALAVFDQAAAAMARPAEVLSDKAVLLTQLGRLREACEIFDRALGLAPTLADAWYNKSNAKTYAPDDPDVTAMERLLGGHCSYRDRLLLHFALGKACMDAGRTEAAFRHWHDGNRMKRAIVDYDADAVAAQMASIAARPAHFGASCRGADSAGGVRLSTLPLFIVGMPRCGSSLVEQILASHPQVYGAGESSGLRALFEEAPPEPADPAAAGVEDRIAAAAVARLRRCSAQADRIVDKDLGNFLHLGTIHRIFPRARIIHCRRDPLDTCFSAYTKLFLGDLNFSYDLGELGRHYLGYHGLMQHWRRVLPPEVLLEVDYEALVVEPQMQTRRLLDFLGLPWNEACLRFFDNRRKISTASAAQVRVPIYRSSVGRARSLRQRLQPLIQALGDLASADGA